MKLKVLVESQCSASFLLKQAVRTGLCNIAGFLEVPDLPLIPRRAASRQPNMEMRGSSGGTLGGSRGSGGRLPAALKNCGVVPQDALQVLIISIN